MAPAKEATGAQIQSRRQDSREPSSREDRGCRCQGCNRDEDGLKLQVDFGHEQTALIHAYQVVED